MPNGRESTSHHPNPDRNGDALKKTCTCSDTGRNLVVCIDGTSNKFGEKNTNVIEFYSLLEKDTKQQTFYNSGIGTYAPPSWKSLSYWLKVMENTLDLAFAMYKGFSRGAYQVRVLAAMIDAVGLIHKGNEAQIPFAYEVYTSIYDTQGEGSSRKGRSSRDRYTTGKKTFSEQGTQTEEETLGLQEIEKSGTQTATEDTVALPEVGKTPTERATQFKKAFSRIVQVHFVGVWDTVAAIGSAPGKILPFTTTGMSSVCLFRHALALDERRVKFIPEFAYGSTTLSAQTNPRTQSTSDQHIKEVWFVGSHSDVGGGLVPNIAMTRYEPPLRWMCYEAISAGIRINLPLDQWSTEPCAMPHESLTGFWKLLEYLPIVPKSNRHRRGMLRRFHMGDGRRIMEGQRIHNSVYDYMKKNPEYCPKAVISTRSFWTWEVLTSEDTWVEQDILCRMRDVTRNLEKDLNEGHVCKTKDFLELDGNAKTELGKLVLQQTRVVPSVLCRCVAQRGQTDMQSLEAMMSTLLILSADCKDRLPFDDIYPAERTEGYLQLPTLEPYDATSKQTTSSRGPGKFTFARFFRYFSAGAGKEYAIKTVDEKFILSAGEIQGVYQGAVYGVQGDKDAIVTVISTRALTSVVTVENVTKPEPFRTSSSRPIRPGKNWALRVAIKAQEDKLDQLYLQVVDELEEAQRKINSMIPFLIVEDSKAENPDLILIPSTTCSRKSGFCYRLSATHWEDYIGLESLSCHLSKGYLADILYGGAAFYWLFHLARKGDNESQAQDWPISLTCFRNRPYTTNSSIYPIDTIRAGIEDYADPVHVDTSGKYSYLVENLSNKSFYIHLLFLDSSFHSIERLTENPDYNRMPVAPKSGIVIGELDTNTGDFMKRGNAMSFCTLSDRDKNLGFLVVLLGEKYVDYSNYYQESPFFNDYNFRDVWRNKPLDKPYRTLFVPIIITEDED